MASIHDSLNGLLGIDGALCAALVDSTSGMLMGSVGSGLDMELAAAGNTEVVRAKLKTMRMLKLDDAIDDILITLTHQYHIIRPVAAHEGVFFYLVLDKRSEEHTSELQSQSNLVCRLLLEKKKKK